MGHAFDTTTGYPTLISQWMENGDVLAYVKKMDVPPETLLRLVSSDIKLMV